jgi:membrane-bound hydrogenase subunit beta
MTDTAGENLLTPEEVLERIQSVCGQAISDARIDRWKEGVKQVETAHIWIRIDRDMFKVGLREIAKIHYPHMVVISGCDNGDAVELLYHFLIYYGYIHKSIQITLCISAPKDDLTFPTITDIIPGALVSEREKMEMLGVTILGIPDDRRMFLPLDFPEGVYPWRRDDTGVPDEMVRELWRLGRDEKAQEFLEGDAERAALAKAEKEAKAKARKEASQQKPKE